MGVDTRVILWTLETLVEGVGGLLKSLLLILGNWSFYWRGNFGGNLGDYYLIPYYSEGSVIFLRGIKGDFLIS